jgi:TonB family protein
MMDFRLVTLALAMSTATADELYFHSDVTNGPTPAIRITVTEKNDAANGSQSSLTRDTGKCHVLMWVTSDGYVRVAQVIESSGLLSLDSACLSAVIGQRMQPSRDFSGQPTDHWVDIPIIWSAKGSLAAKPAKAPDRPDVPIALLSPNQTLPIKAADYPRGALRLKQQGRCTVHVDLSPSGKVRALIVTQSTGSAELDESCRKVLRVAQFMPVALSQMSVGASTDVALSWIIADEPSPASSPLPR